MNKNINLALLITIIISSSLNCYDNSIIDERILRKDNKQNIWDIEVGKIYDYGFDNSIEVKNLNKALNYVHDNMAYETDSDLHNTEEYWQLPEESYELRKGDCEDHAIFLMYLLETKLNIETRFLILHNKITGNYHAVVYAEGFYLDATGGFKTNYLFSAYEVIYDISYEEVIWMVFNYHRNVGVYYF